MFNPETFSPIAPLGRLERLAIAAADNRNGWAKEHNTLLGEFAAQNDLTANKRYFGLSDLGQNRLRSTGKRETLGLGLWDHVFKFRRDGRPAAVVIQPWAAPEDVAKLVEYVSGLGLIVQSPPNPWASFHWPGSTHFFVVTRWDFGPVRWHPAQLQYRVYGTN